MNKSDKKDFRNTKETYVKIYLSDIVKGIKKFWWLCIVVAIITASVKVAMTVHKHTPVYKASATVTVSTQNSSTDLGGLSVYSFYYDTSTASQLSSTFPYILASNLLQDAVCEDLDIEYMPVSLSATVVESSNMFTITATGSDPQLTYDVLLSSVENYPSVAKYVVGNIRFEIITPPVVPTAPSNPIDYTTEIMVGVILGLAVGFVIIFIYVIQRKTIKTKKDIRQELNLETIAVIPEIIRKKRTVATSQKLTIKSQNINSTFSESFRVMRNVFLASLENDEKIIMVTSSVPGEGKTTVVTNLALSLSENGKKVLLVDADVRNPSVLELLNVNEENIDFEVEPELYKKTFIDEYNIHFMVPLSTKDEKLFSRKLNQIFESMKNDYDYIIVDTPPTGLISDAMYISQACDAVLYVVYQDVVKVSRIRSNIDNLMATDVRILGCVLNGAANGFGSYGYGYGGYGYGGYGYGYGGYGYGKKKRKKQ